MTPARLLLSSLTLASLLALSTGAAAQSSAYRDGNSYLGLNAGRTDFNVGNGTGVYGSDDSNTAYGITMGSYFRDSNLGMEFGYTDFGDVSRGGGRTQAHGIHLNLIGRMPIGSSFNLLGKVGGIYSRTDVSSSPGSGISSGSESGLDWTYGVGMEFAFARQWSAVVQYDDYNVKFAGGGSDRISNLSLGLRYVY